MSLRRSHQQSESVCVELKVMTGTAVTPLFWWPSSITVASPKAPSHTSWARHSSPWQHTHLSEHRPERWKQTHIYVPCSSAQNGKVWHHKYNIVRIRVFMSSRNQRGQDGLHNRMKIWMLLTWVTREYRYDRYTLSFGGGVCVFAMCNAQQKHWGYSIR